MKNAQEYIEKLQDGEVIEAEETVMVRSSSDPSNEYRLIKIEGSWVCNCPGYAYRGKCKHVDKLLQDEKNRKNN